MDSRVRAVLNKVASTVEFVGVKFDNVNATNAFFGDIALHCVCLWGRRVRGNADRCRNQHRSIRR